MNYVQQTKRRYRDLNRRGFLYPNRTNGVPFLLSDANTVLSADGKYVKVFPCKQCCGAKSVWDFSVRWEGTLVQCPTCKGVGHTKKTYVTRTVQSRRLLPPVYSNTRPQTGKICVTATNTPLPDNQRLPRIIRPAEWGIVTLWAPPIICDADTADHSVKLPDTLTTLQNPIANIVTAKCL